MVGEVKAKRLSSFMLCTPTSCPALLARRLKMVKGEHQYHIPNGEKKITQKRAECCNHYLSLSSAAQTHIKGNLVRRPPEVVKHSHITSTSAASEKILSFFSTCSSRAIARALVLTDFKARVATQILCRELQVAGMNGACGVMPVRMVLLA